MGGIMHLPYDTTVKLMLASLERNLLPDLLIRRGTRLLLASRLRSAYKPSSELQLSDLLQFVQCELFFLYLLLCISKFWSLCHFFFCVVGALSTSKNYKHHFCINYHTRPPSDTKKPTRIILFNLYHFPFVGKKKKN